MSQMTLEETVERFLQILAIREESSNGIEFSPIEFHSVRKLLSEEVKEILKRMEELTQ